MTTLPRSILFVPGDRPDRFAKAMASGADAICLDLEDAVAQDTKAEARDHVLAYLATAAEPARVMVRISALSTLAGLADILALAQSAVAPAAVMMAKVSSPDQVTATLACLAEAGHGAVRALALIEDAQGLRRAHQIAAAPGMLGLSLGPLDMAASFGAAFDEDALRLIRFQLRAAAAEAGIAAWDGPYPNVADEAGLDRAAASCAALGFAGKLCIHPKQVAAVNAAFSPSAGAVAHARAVVEAAERTTAGAFMLDGKMIDAPVILAARQVLARA
jgi:(S)-citramalyl-CoA lyase